MHDNVFCKSASPSRRAFSSGVRFFLAIIKTSNVVLLFYTTSEVYTNFGMVSTLLETYSYYSSEGRLLTELEAMLRAKGVEFKERARPLP